MNELVLARALVRGGLLLLAVVALVLLGLELRWVAVQVFAAAVVAAGMAPVVTRLTDPDGTRSGRRRPPPALVVVLIYLVVGLVVLGLGTILLRAVLTQATLLVEQAPAYALTVQDWYAGVARRWPPLEQLDLVDLLGGTVGLTRWIVGALRQVLSAADLLPALFGGALNVIFVLFMALYLTVDGRSMRDYLLVFLPAGRRARARRIITTISSRLGQWVVGQFLVCVIAGAGAGIGLGLLGVPGAALLALVWAVCVLIPGIGPFLSAAPTILLGFLAGPTVGVLATVFALVWSQVENNVVVPRVMGRAVKLNALVVLVAVLAGHQLLGLAGALFAIPLAAALAVVVDELHEDRLLAERDAELEPTAPAVSRP
jgi:predicted PurR-regulated permease PerM